MKRNHAQTGVDLTYVKLSTEWNGDAGDPYTGLDRFGRVVDQRWRTSTTDLDRYQYGYDGNSNRLYRENLISSSNSELYSYDGLNQLASMQRGTLNNTKTALSGSATRSQSWNFDALANFDSQTTDGVTQTRSHNKQNEITSLASATTPTYDANGNMTGDESGRTFVYDAWNRLVEVKSNGGTTLATYAWDVAGRRVRETRSSTTTDLYYSDSWQVLEERVGGNTRRSYAWSPVYVDAMIARDRDSDNNGTLEERLYVAHDANFNVTALINTSGSIVERYQYDAFGSFSVLEPAWGSRSNSNYAWNYLHQGGRWDADAGVYSFRHREYSPTLGRWMTNDPIGFAGGDWNLYRAYVNSPNEYIDPIGLYVFDPDTDFAGKGKFEAGREGLPARNDMRMLVDIDGSAVSIHRDTLNFYGTIYLKRNTDDISARRNISGFYQSPGYIEIPFGRCLPNPAANIFIVEYDDCGRFSRIAWYNIGSNLASQQYVANALWETYKFMKKLPKDMKNLYDVENNILTASLLQLANDGALKPRGPEFKGLVYFTTKYEWVRKTGRVTTQAFTKNEEQWNDVDVNFQRPPDLPGHQQENRYWPKLPEKNKPY